MGTACSTIGTGTWTGMGSSTRRTTCPDFPAWDTNGNGVLNYWDRDMDGNGQLDKADDLSRFPGVGHEWERRAQLLGPGHGREWAARQGGRPVPISRRGTRMGTACSTIGTGTWTGMGSSTRRT